MLGLPGREWLSRRRMSLFIWQFLRVLPTYPRAHHRLCSRSFSLVLFCFLNFYFQRSLSFCHFFAKFSLRSHFNFFFFFTFSYFNLFLLTDFCSFFCWPEIFFKSDYSFTTVNGYFLKVFFVLLLLFIFKLVVLQNVFVVKYPSKDSQVPYKFGQSLSFFSLKLW